MKRRLRKLASLTLCVCIIFGTTSIPTFATDTTCTTYASYVCLGDNIAKGINKESIDDINDDGFGSLDAGYVGTVQSKLNTPYTASYAHNGYRAAEVRALIDKSYKNNDEYATEIPLHLLAVYTYDLELGYSDDIADGQDAAINDLKKGGVVTVQCGNMDLLMMPILNAVSDLSSKQVMKIINSSDVSVWNLAKIIMNGESMATEDVESIIRAVFDSDDFMNYWKTELENGADEYCENIEAVVKKINELSNGKATVVLPSVYMTRDTIAKIDLGALGVNELVGVEIGPYLDQLESKGVLDKFESQVEVVNNKMISLSQTYDYVEYADISGVAIDDSSLPATGDAGYGYIGQQIVNQVPATHNLTHVTAKDKTCTTDGNTEYWSCSRCGNYYSDKYGLNEINKSDTVVAATGHTGGEATCQELATCTECGKKYGNYAAHDLKKTDAVAAGCTTAGNSEYWTCETCGKYFSDAEGKNTIEENSWVITANGHTWSKTWTSDGTKHWHACTVDGCDAKNNEAACSGGTPTCLAKAVCTTCNQEYGDKADHNWDTAWTSDGTNHWHACTVDGCDAKSDEAACSGGTATCLAKAVCEACQQEYGDLAGHSWSSTYEKDENNHWKTCTTEGCTATTDKVAHSGGTATCQELATCTECGKKYGNYAAHDLKKTAAVAAGCTTDGNSEYWTCKTCGKYFSDAEGTNEINENTWIIQPKGHTWSKTWTSDGTKHWHACTVDGCDAKNNEAACSGGTPTCLAKAVCTTCNQEYGDKADHNWDTAWTSDGTKHWHACTVDGCDAKSDEAACSGGIATCLAKAVCDVCQQEYGEYGAHTGGTATCLAKAVCTVCEQEYGELAEHSWDEGVVTTEATTTATGVMTYTCTVEGCGKTKEEVIPKKSIGGGGGSGGGGGGGAASTEDQQDAKIEVTIGEDGKVEVDLGKSAEVETEGSQTRIVVEVSQDIAEALVEAAEEQQKTELVINAAEGQTANSDTKSELVLPAELLNEIIKSDSIIDTIEIKTDAVESMIIDKATMKAIAKAGGSSDEITIVVERSEITENGKERCNLEVSIYVGGTRVSQFNGGKIELEVAVPDRLKDKDLDVLYIDDNKRAHEVENKSQNKKAGTFSFEISHNSGYAIMEAEDAEELLNESNIDAVKESKINVKSATANKNGSITIKWRKSAVCEMSGYRVFRATSANGKYKRIATVKAGTLKYIDKKNLKKNKKYYYKVRGIAKINDKNYYTLLSDAKYAKCRKTVK